MYTLDDPRIKDLQKTVKIKKVFVSLAIIDARDNVHMIENTHCHAGLGRLSHTRFPIKAYADWVLNDFHKDLDKENRDKYKGYVDWLINHSTWADAYLVKNIEDAMNKPMVYDIYYPSKYIVQAAIALRYLSEKRCIIDNWFILRDYVDDNLAFLLAHMLRKSEKDFLILPFDTGHSIMNGMYLSEEGIKRILTNNKELFSKLMPMYKKTEFYPLIECWQKDEKGGATKHPEFNYPISQFKLPIRIITTKRFNQVRKTEGVAEKDLEGYLDEVLETFNLTGWKKHD